MSLETKPLLFNYEMNDKNNNINPKLVGLTFVKYHRHVRVHEENEKHDTLSKEVSALFERIERELKNQEHFLSNNVKNDDTNLLDYVTKSLGLLEKINKCHEKVTRFLDEYCKKNDECDFSSIANFCPRYRGFFISILHFFNTQLKGISVGKNKEHKLKGRGKRKKLVDKQKRFIDILQKFLVLYEACVNLEELYLEIYGDSKIDFYCSGYSKKVDMDEVDFDYSLFYESIGNQYSIQSSVFHNMYLSFLAGYSKICENELLKKIYLLRDLSYFVIGLFYLLNKKKRAKAVFDFGSIEEFKRTGCFLWNFQDDPVIAPTFDFFVLKGVHYSKVFELKVKELNYKKDNLIIDILKENNEVEEKIEIPKKVEKKKEQQIVITIEGKEESSESISDNQNSDSHEENTPDIEVVPKTSGEKKNDIQSLLFTQRRKESGGTKLGVLLKYYKDLCSTTIFNESVGVRLILPKKVKNLNDNLKSNSVEDMPFMNFFKKIINGTQVKSLFGKETDTSAIMIHFHGGGFISMSSHSHESYTRKWAYNLNIPIFSVDYTVAPKKKFPFQLLQCYQAYKYIVNLSSEIFKKKVEKIFLVGDSAGANLVFSVTLLAIIEKERVPDGLVMSYPTGITAYEPCPSRICSLIDPLVSKPFLKLVLNQYPSDKYSAIDKSTNSFLSPITTPDELWKFFPYTYISACSLDPLFDDGVTFAKKLDKYNSGKVKLKIIDCIPHGFLNFSDIIPEAKKEIEKIENWIRKMLN